MVFSGLWKRCFSGGSVDIFWWSMGEIKELFVQESYFLSRNRSNENLSFLLQNKYCLLYFIVADANVLFIRSISLFLSTWGVG